MGAALPLAVIAVMTGKALPFAIAGAALLALALLGGLAAWAGGAKLSRGSVRVTFWSALAIAVTYGVGRMLGTQL